MSIRNIKTLEELLEKNFADNEAYLEALEVVRKNSRGRIWLIGSGVYKVLLNALYNQTHNIKDWDFIVETIVTPLELGGGWELSETRHGNPKLKKADFVIDLIALNNIHSIKERGLESSIENYLSGSPLTIQSIVFDVNKKELLGEIGIQSILDKTIGINNEAEYSYAASIYGDWYSTKRYAEAFGFREVQSF